MNKQEAKEMVLKMKSMNEVRDFIDKLMKEHYEEAVAKTCNHFNVQNHDELQVCDSKLVVFDCGWLLWRFIDKELTDKVKKLTKKSYGYVDSSFRLVMPVYVQSTTMQVIAADVLKQKISDTFELDYYVHLD